MRKKAYFFILPGKIIIIITIIIIVTGVFLTYKPIIQKFRGVASGVNFMGEDIGSFNQEEVEHLVSAFTKKIQRDPIDAIFDEETGTVIPELNGVTLNKERTVERILKAKPDKVVIPIYEEIKPKQTIAEYPLIPISKGNPEKNAVSLLINVAWGNEYLPEMLDVLNKEKVKATFFLLGRWAIENPDLIYLIKDNGHELGNHGHTDSIALTELTYEEIFLGLQETNQLIYDIYGKEVKYFTPHKGEYNEVVCQAAANLQMKTILWSVDTVDWMLPGVSKMVQKVKDEIYPGAMLLMHPTSQTPELLSIIIPMLKEKGYKIVTVGELISPRPFF